MIALCSKTYCCYDEQSDTVKLSSKGLNKNNIEEPLAKYRKVLFDEDFGKSTIRKYAHMNSKKWDCHTFIPSVKSVKMEFTLLH